MKLLRHKCYFFLFFFTFIYIRFEYFYFIVSISVFAVFSRIAFYSLEKKYQAKKKIQTILLHILLIWSNKLEEICSVYYTKVWNSYEFLVISLINPFGLSLLKLALLVDYTNTWWTESIQLLLSWYNLTPSLIFSFK